MCKKYFLINTYQSYQFGKAIIPFYTCIDPMHSLVLLKFDHPMVAPIFCLAHGLSGFMSKVHNGYGVSVDGCEEPKSASFIFPPFLDMDPNDNSCILSVFHYFSNIAEKYGVTPIIIHVFGKALYEKTYKLIENAPPGSKLKRFVLVLGSFHTEMSYVGAIAPLCRTPGSHASWKRSLHQNLCHTS